MFCVMPDTDTVFMKYIHRQTDRHKYITFVVGPIPGDTICHTHTHTHTHNTSYLITHLGTDKDNILSHDLH